MSPNAFPDTVPELTDGVVRLRAHRPSDAAAIVEQCTDPLTQRWTTVPRHYDLEQARTFLGLVEDAWNDPDGHRYWAIEWTPAGGAPRFAGTVDLRPDKGGVASIGYGLHPLAREEGVMARTVRLLARHAFSEGLGHGPLSRIYWYAAAGNFDSRRVAWACGFTHHGTLPSYLAQPTVEGGHVLLDAWVASLSAIAPMVPATPWLEVPVIEGDGIRLRPWLEGDVDHLEPMVQPAHFMPKGAAPEDLTFDFWLLSRRERAADGTAVQWCIADGGSDRPLGSVMFFSPGAPITGPSAEIGYFLFPGARGRGVVERAANLAIEHAFTPAARDGLGLSRVTAVTAADNDASRRVLTRLGFAIWGVEHRTDLLPDGTWQDADHWELLR